MTIYVEFTDYSIFLEYICEKLQIPFLPVLISPSSLSSQKLRLQNWNQLEQNLSGSGFFQDDLTDSKTVFMVDLDELEINKNTINYIIASNSNLGVDVYLYSSVNESLDADTKKLFKKANISIESLKKINPITAQKIALEYASQLQLPISSIKLNTLSSQALSYYEIINDLEFLELVGSQNSDSDINLAITQMIKHEKPALYIQNFTKNDINNWYKNVTADDLQLALSLIYTKLEKINTTTSKKTLQNLIQTDQKIKTNNKVGAMTWYKLFLWKAKNL